MGGRRLRASSGTGWLTGMIVAVALAAAGLAGAGSAAASAATHTVAAVKSPATGGGSRHPAVTSPAAVPPPGYGTGPGYCTGYAGGVTSGYSFDNVYACQGTTTGATTFDNPGPIYAWQCVELSARFLWAIYGIWAGPGSGVQDGADLVSGVHASHPTIAVGTPSPGSVPVAGDVISLGPGGGSDPKNGHTAAVISANPGAGQFVVMSENAPEGQAGEQTLKVDLSGGHNGQVLFSGAWTTASWLALGTAAVHRAPYDVNGDGLSDLCQVTGVNGGTTGSGHAEVHCLYGGNFQSRLDIAAPWSYLKTSTDPLFMADINGDGRADLCQVTGVNGGTTGSGHAEVHCLDAASSFQSRLDVATPWAYLNTTTNKILDQL